MIITKSKIQKIIQEELDLVSEIKPYIVYDPEWITDKDDLSDDELERGYERRYGDKSTFQGSGRTKPSDKRPIGQLRGEPQVGDLPMPRKRVAHLAWKKEDDEREAEDKARRAASDDQRAKDEYDHLTKHLNEEELVERVLNEFIIVTQPKKRSKTVAKPKKEPTPQTPGTRHNYQDETTPNTTPSFPPPGGLHLYESDEDAESLDSLSEEISHFFEAKLLDEKDGEYLKNRIQDHLRGFTGGKSAERQKMNDLFDVVIKNAVLDYLMTWSDFTQEEETLEDEE